MRRIAIQLTPLGLVPILVAALMMLDASAADLLTRLGINSEGSQGIEGHVSTSSGVPMPSVVVWVEGTSIETLTTAEGHYEIDNLAAGTYRIFAFKPGYFEAAEDGVVHEATLSTLELSLVPRPGIVRRVPEDYPSIQQAVDAALAGDTVLVEPGIYHEPVIIRFKLENGVRVVGRPGTGVAAPSLAFRPE